MEIDSDQNELTSGRISSGLFWLAGPMCASALLQNLQSLIDLFWVGRLGSEAVAALAMSGTVLMLLFPVLMGVAAGTVATVARHIGAGEPDAAAEVAGQSLLMALFFGVVAAAVGWPAIPGLCRLLGAAPMVAQLGTDYLRIWFLGSFTAFLMFIGNSVFRGAGNTVLPMFVMLSANVVNLVLDPVLIFGLLGMPALGVRGAAIASTIAVAVGTVYFTVIALAPRHREVYGTVWAIFARHRWTGGILRLSVPVFVQRLIAHGSWFAFFGVVARIGTLELAASNVIRSIYSLPIMVAVGLGTASAALVGQRLGAGKPDEAEGLAWEASKLAAYAMGVIGLLFVLAPEWVFRIYTTDAAVIAVGRRPLIILGFVQMLAGIALVLSQSLQGAGSTRFVMLAELGVCALLYLPIVYVLGLHSGLGIIGAWTAEYIYWSVLAGIMGWQFRRGTWKTIVL